MATGEQGDITRSELKKNWGVLTALVSKDFKIKYRRSVLGVVWSVLNPLLMMVVMTAVFSYMFKFNIEHFPLYLILGNILFGLMSTATTTAMKSIVDSSSLIKKIRIEKAIFPVEKVLFALVNFAFLAHCGCLRHDLSPGLPILADHPASRADHLRHVVQHRA